MESLDLLLVDTALQNLLNLSSNSPKMVSVSSVFSLNSNLAQLVLHTNNSKADNTQLSQCIKEVAPKEQIANSRRNFSCLKPKADLRLEGLCKIFRLTSNLISRGLLEPTTLPSQIVVKSVKTLPLTPRTAPKKRTLNLSKWLVTLPFQQNQLPVRASELATFNLQDWV